MPALLVAFANHSARLALAHGPRKISTRRFNYTEMSSKCFSQVKKKKEIIKAEQCVPDTWLWEYRIRRTPLRSPSFSKLVVGARGRESLRGSSSILAPTLEESKHRSIRPEQLLLLSSLDGARRWKFRDVCVAEMRGRISRVTRTILFRLPHRLRINQPRADLRYIFFARGMTPLWPASRYRNAYRCLYLL